MLWCELASFGWWPHALTTGLGLGCVAVVVAGVESWRGVRIQRGRGRGGGDAVGADVGLGDGVGLRLGIGLLVGMRRGLRRGTPDQGRSLRTDTKL